LAPHLGYAQAPVESFATELISLAKDIKDVQKDVRRLAPITIGFLNESPKWDKARLDKEFGTLWAVLAKPPGMRYLLYGGHLDGAASQASNPTVRAMIQEIAERSDNESIEQIARGVLAK
jgi:hypothetical protein